MSSFYIRFQEFWYFLNSAFKLNTHAYIVIDSVWIILKSDSKLTRLIYHMCMMRTYAPCVHKAYNLNASILLSHLPDPKTEVQNDKMTKYYFVIFSLNRN